MNVFVKPYGQSQTCLSYVVARKGARKRTFRLSHEQKELAHSAMAEKGRMKFNVFLNYPQFLVKIIETHYEDYFCGFTRISATNILDYFSVGVTHSPEG